MGAGVRRPARFDLTRSDAKEMTFILEHAPQLTADGRRVPPVPPPPTHATAAPFGFERGQVFSTDQSAVVQQRQQDQQVRGQVRQFAVPSFILFPTLCDARFTRAAVFLPARKMSGEGNVPLVVRLPGCLHQLPIAFPTGFEAVNLAAQAWLPAIDTTAVAQNLANHPAVQLVSP